MASNISQFELILKQLLSIDNTARKQAEDAYNETKKNPEFLIASLVHFIRLSTDEQVRDLCCVLLRRALGSGNDSLWGNISPQAQATVKIQLLEIMEMDQSQHSRGQVANCISELALTIFDPKNPNPTTAWPELLPFLFKLVKSDKPGLRETALNIFADLAPHLGDVLRPHFPLLKEVLVSGLNDTSSLAVRTAALEATCSFLRVLDKPEERIHFQELIPLMLGTLSAALNAQQEEEARTALQLFVDLGESDPTFLKPQLIPILNAMLMIAQATTLEESTRQLGLEFLVTLSEARAGMIRKQTKFLEALVPTVLKFMLEIEDNSDWATTKPDEDDNVDISNSDVGEECLDRLALCLGGKTLVPLLFQSLPGLMSSPEWTHRHTALMAMCIIGEGCEKILRPNLPDLIKNILPFFQDPHPRVRWAACNTIGQMSTDFGPTLQRDFHAQVVPALMSIMDDKDNPRVQAHAAAAMVNFCEACEPSIIQPYLDTLLSKLYSLLQSGKLVVQEQAITAIAAVADCIEDDFVKYYDTLMPLLKTILTNATSKEYRRLRGKTMECISLIGVAVKKEKFFNDAKEVMDILIRTQSGQLEADDPQVGFFLQAGARICKCLGNDFVPYLNFVMPSLIQSAKIPPEIQVLDENAAIKDGWEYIPVENKKLGINTSTLEDKSTACNMLYVYAKELGEGFFPYVDEVAKLLVPLLKFYYHEGVRISAFNTLPYLLSSAQAYLQKHAASGADKTYVRNLFNFMYGPMLSALEEELDLEVLIGSLESLSETIAIPGPGVMSAEQLQATYTLLQTLLTDVKNRRAERLAMKKEDDHDEEEEERIGEEEERDEEINSLLADCLGNLFKSYKEATLPYFQNLIFPIIVEMLKGVTSDKQVALCVFDDLIEHLGAHAVPFLQHYLPIAIPAINDADPAVRQASVYGMGLCAQFGGQQMASVIPEITQRLTQVITLPDARSDDWACATENAIAAIGKICIFQAGAVDVSKLLPMWFSWLPVTQDNIEAKVTYAQLCSFIESSNPYIIGANFQNLPRILSIFAEILDTDLVDEALTHRIKVIIAQIRNGVSAETLQGAWGSLQAAHQQKLQPYFA
mmetsp:Transcript_21433/g.29989  ORF Transcript_21433/g.29989 Transcript_21433/m.29989 type:complete len:1094 (-) Transcript_21433:418-3699(-)